MKKKTENEILGIYNIPMSEKYNMSKKERMKKLNYISIYIKAKPNLEDFVHLNSFDAEAEAGDFEEKENQTCHYNFNLKLILQYVPKKSNKQSTIIGEPIPKHFKTDESFTVFGKPKSILRYLKKNYPKTHLRLYNYLERGIDSKQIKEILIEHGSQAHVKAYEGLTGIKLKIKEE